MRSRCVALVPAKASSRRIPEKNLRPFWRGMSLLEIKVRTLLICPAIDEIVVSSDDSGALRLAESLGATPAPALRSCAATKSTWEDCLLRCCAHEGTSCIGRT
jgi:N-acylneuraminate cytidylyltransferase